MTFRIEADWESLATGTPAERACFAAVGISANGTWLTEADDSFVNRVREKVHLSAYRLAEWLAWNWWRLRWEPPNDCRADWAFAHRLSTIGGGYVWPDITIVSDGAQITVASSPTQAAASEPLRYINYHVFSLPATEFEGAIDRFLEQVRGQLAEERVHETNFHRIWGDVLEERTNASSTIWRRLEAMLGYEPDEADPEIIERLKEDSEVIGHDAIEEIASASLAEEVTSRQLLSTADGVGFAGSQDGLEGLPEEELPAVGHVPAWRRGEVAARLLRQRLGLGTDVLDNPRLAELAGVSPSALNDDRSYPLLSYSLDSGQHRRYVFRSRWQTGRRFELARLLGDNLTSHRNGSEPLRPATRARTYRQMVQRAFAAQLLCPFEAVTEILQGDFSAEAMEDAAQQFQVSERVIRNQLVNHHCVGRDYLEAEFGAFYTHYQ